MNERLKRIRKHFDLTQQSFADRLGIQRNTVAMYEMGRTHPSDAIILSICREFNVNEDWLRNGAGDMFLEKDTEAQLMEWAGRVFSNRDDGFKQRFVTMLMGLSESEWDLLEKKAKELFEEEHKEEN